MSYYDRHGGYIPGGVWGICDRCSEKRRLSMLVREWTNLMVCVDHCLDPRPPQLDPPVVWAEGTPLPNASPRPADIFVGAGAYTPSMDFSDARNSMYVPLI